MSKSAKKFVYKLTFIERMILFFIFVSIFGNLFIWVLFFLIGNPFIAKLLVLKDILLFLLIILIIIRFIVKNGSTNYLNTIVAFCILFYIAIVFVYFMIFSVKDFYLLRRNLILFVVLFAFLMYRTEILNISAIINRFIIWTIISVILSFVFYFLPLEFFYMLKLQEFWLNTGVDSWAEVSLEYSGRFYSYDLYFLIGEKIRRNIGIYLEPTTSAHLILLGLAFLIYSSSKKKRFLIILVIAGLSTISKAFVLGLFTLIFLYFVRSYLFHLLYLTFVSILIAILFSNEELGGYTAHVLGFSSGINSLTTNIFGMGFGAAGNYGILQIGSESAFGSLIGQFGIFYMLLFFALLFVLFLLYKKYNKSKNNIFYAIYSSMYVWMIIHLFSESALGFSGNVFYFIFAGLGLGVKDGKE
jgi:hypothetical protein